MTTTARWLAVDGDDGWNAAAQDAAALVEPRWPAREQTGYSSGPYTLSLDTVAYVLYTGLTSWRPGGQTDTAVLVGELVSVLDVEYESLRAQVEAGLRRLGHDGDQIGRRFAGFTAPPLPVNLDLPSELMPIEEPSFRHGVRWTLHLLDGRPLWPVLAP